MTGYFRYSGFVFAAGLGLLLVSWWQTIAHMAGVLWNVDVFAHGLLIPFVSVALIWARREQLARLDVCFSPWGLILLLGASFLHITGELLDVALFGHLAFIVALQGLVILAFGIIFYHAILFPMTFLFLAVPFGYELVAPLQAITANIVIAALDLMGAEFSAEGMLIELSSGIYEVAEACAGVKFLFTSVVTGILLANLVYQNWKRRLAIVVVSALLPIIANALRVLGILGIAELTDQSFAKDVDHIIYGWVFLSIVLFALISVAYRFSDKRLVSSIGDKPWIPEGILALSMPRWGAFLAIFMPMIAAHLVPGYPSKQLENFEQAGPLFADAPEGYRVLSDTRIISRPVFLNADLNRFSLLRKNGAVFSVHMAVYEGLSASRRLFQPGNSLANVQWFEMRGLGQKIETVCNWTLTEQIYRRGNERMLIWPLYLVNGVPVNNGPEEKIRTALSRLSREPAFGQILVLSAPIRTDAEETRKIFSEFLSTFSSDSTLWTVGGLNKRDSILCAE